MRIVNPGASPTCMETAGATICEERIYYSESGAVAVGFHTEQHEVGSLSCTIHKSFQMVLRT